jgi:hypothetical protein
MRQRTSTESTKLFLWNWQGGGYNCCRAKDRDEAIKKANEFCAELVPNESTLRECTSAEVVFIVTDLEDE